MRGAASVADTYHAAASYLFRVGRGWLRTSAGATAEVPTTPSHTLRSGSVRPRGAQVLGRVTGNLSFFLLQGHMCDVCVYGFVPSWSREPLKENKKTKKLKNKRLKNKLI